MHRRATDWRGDAADWAMKFDASGPDGGINHKPPRQTSRLKHEHRKALAVMIEQGPIPARRGVVRRRVIDLCQWIFEDYRFIITAPTLSREPHKTGYGGASPFRSQSRFLHNTVGYLEKPLVFRSSE